MKDVNVTKLKALKVLNKDANLKKIYADKNLCGVNTKYAPR